MTPWRALKQIRLPSERSFVRGAVWLVLHVHPRTHRQKVFLYFLSSSIFFAPRLRLPSGGKKNATKLPISLPNSSTACLFREKKRHPYVCKEDLFDLFVHTFDRERSVQFTQIRAVFIRGNNGGSSGGSRVRFSQTFKRKKF